MQTGAEILKQVLSYTGESINSLAKKINLKRSQNLYDLKKGKVKKVSAELSERIITTYPEINREWLRTGDGDMLLGKLNEAGKADEKYLIKKNPFPKNASKEWDVIEALVQEIAVDRSRTSKRSVVDCLEELYAKIDLIINGDDDV